MLGEGGVAQTGNMTKTVHSIQKQGFYAWKHKRESTQTGGSTAVYSAGHPLSQLISGQFIKNETGLSISPSSLAVYFQCPLKWVFARVLSLEDLEIETGIMADNITGLVYHAALNLFLADLKKSGEKISPPVDAGNGKKPKAQLPSYYHGLLLEKTKAVFECFPALPGSGKTEMSMLTARLLRAQKDMFYARLEKFLAEFISFFSGYRVVASEPHYFFENGSYCLNGKLDCVLEDAREDSAAYGSLVIVDFKTVKTPKLSDCFTEEGLSDFQIPAYLRLAEATQKKQVDTTLFFSIHDAKAQVWFGAIRNVLNGTPIPKNAEDCIMRGGDIFTNIMDEFDSKTVQFAKEVPSGAFMVSPLYCGHCYECSYNKVCRTLYKIR
jgi:ATP-dependent helicase/DNAse subunit B